LRWRKRSNARNETKVLFLWAAQQSSNSKQATQIGRLLSNTSGINARGWQQRIMVLKFEVRKQQRLTCSERSAAISRRIANAL
jgi:hypothetical protein